MPPRSAIVRFYFDEDVLGLAKVVADLRSDVTFPDDPGKLVKGRLRAPCPITRGTPDEEWIPNVTQSGWLIVTKDSKISRRPGEIRAVQDYGARLIAINETDERGTWAQLEILMHQWRKIEALPLSGPFIYSASRSSLRRIDSSGET